MTWSPGRRAYFLEGNTRTVAWPGEQLNAITTVIDESRDATYDALWHDLRRNRTDADLMDVDSVHGYEKGGAAAGDDLMAGHGRWPRPWIAS